MLRFHRLAAVLALGGILLLSAFGAAHAAPATWSLDRASLGLDAKGAVTDASGSRSTAFLPGVYLSWSATSQLSVAATVEQDFASNLTLSRAGARFLIAHMGDGGQVGAGASIVGYSGDGAASIVEPTSWEASLHGSYPVFESAGRTVVWGILSASFDPENERQTYRVGLRWQAIGGRP